MIEEIPRDSPDLDLEAIEAAEAELIFRAELEQ